MKQLIAGILISFISISATAQCASAGNDTIVTRCKNEPFDVALFLTDSASLGGVWYDPAYTVMLSTTVPGYNFPGQYNFKYIVTDTICNTSDTALIKVTILTCWTGIVNESKASSIVVSPNPTSGGVFSLSQDVPYTIEDATGKQLKEITASGVYFVVVGQKRFRLVNL
ncbi:MAG: hypothetical protein KA734_00435 [Fluviicola sp.]|nr:hypothetical protein [Fluviicola sp.]